jgi:hypothetical protein
MKFIYSLVTLSLLLALERIDPTCPLFEWGHFRTPHFQIVGSKKACSDRIIERFVP